MKVEIFVCSLAREFAAERLALKNEVLPRLRQRFFDKDLEIELRHCIDDEFFGVDPADALAENLQQIQEADVFVALLGNRYGQGISEGPVELLQAYPDLLGAEVRSGIGHQIQYAVLDRPEFASRSLFLLRDPQFVDEVPPALRAAMLPASEMHADRVSQLVDAVLDTNARSTRYQAGFDVTHSPPEDLEQFVDRATALLVDILDHGQFAGSRTKSLVEPSEESDQSLLTMQGSGFENNAYGNDEGGVSVVAEPVTAQPVAAQSASPTVATAERLPTATNAELNTAPAPSRRRFEKRVVIWLGAAVATVVAAGLLAMLVDLQITEIPEPANLISGGRLSSLPRQSQPDAHSPVTVETEVEPVPAPTPDVASWTQSLSVETGDFDAYVRKLVEDQQRYDGTEVAALASAVLAHEVPRVQTMQQWQQLLLDWAQTDFREVTVEQAAQMLARADALQVSCEQLPGAKIVQDRVLVLQAIRHRLTGNGEAVASRLEEQLQHEHDLPGFVVQTRTGERFYSHEPPRRNGNDYVIQVADAAGATRTQHVALSDIEPAASGRLNHRSLADSLVADLGELTDRNWESTFVRMLDRISTAERIDPIVQHSWLRSTLAVGMRGSLPLQVAFASHKRSLESVDAAAVTTWRNANQPHIQAARDAARQSVASFPDIRQAARKAAQHYAGLEKFDTPPMLRWVGVLGSEEPLIAATSADGELFWLDTSQDARLVPLTLGRCSGGTVVELTVPPDSNPGSPIWVLPKI